MRLYSYINEDEQNIKEFVLNIKRDCKKYLNDVGKKIFFRGYSGEKRWSGLINTSSDIREPTGKLFQKTSMFSFNKEKKEYQIFNEWLEKNGHCRRDKNVVIATSMEEHASEFGTKYCIFPTGNYDYTFIKSVDFNFNNRRTNYSPFLFKGIWEDSSILNKYLENDEFMKLKNSGVLSSKEKYNNFLNSFLTTNKNIEEAYKNYYEIWFKCKSFYFINYNSLDSILELL